MNPRNFRLPALLLMAASVGGCAQKAAVLPRYVPPPSEVFTHGTTLVKAQGAAAQESPSEPSADASPSSSLLAEADFHFVEVRRLPGGHVNTRGSVRALAFPVVVGGARPTWDEKQLASSLFGTEGFRRTLFDLSAGHFQLDVDILPPLLDMQTQEATLLDARGAERHLTRFSRRVVSEWSGRINFAGWDDDGVDGKPMSGDDDGNVDLTYLLIETQGIPALQEVPAKLKVKAGRGGRLDLRVPTIQVLPVPHRGAQAELRRSEHYALVQAFSYLGVEREDLFFPAPLENEVSTAVRVRLGWLPVARIPAESHLRADLKHGAVLVPIKGRQKGESWLLELRANDLLVSRVLENKDGSMLTLQVTRYSLSSFAPIALPILKSESRAEYLRVGLVEGQSLFSFDFQATK